MLIDNNVKIFHKGAKITRIYHKNSVVWEEKIEPACATTCEKACQSTCETSCQSTCERHCQGYQSCHLTCERYCQGYQIYQPRRERGRQGGGCNTNIESS